MPPHHRETGSTAISPLTVNAAQAEAMRQRRLTADRQAAADHLAALLRAREQDATERKAAQERMIAGAEELQAATGIGLVPLW